MPDHPLWTAAVSLTQGMPVHYVCDEQAEWYPDIDTSSQNHFLILRLLLSSVPIIHREHFIHETFARDRKNVCQNNLIIFADEIYDRMVMDGHAYACGCFQLQMSFVNSIRTVYQNLIVSWASELLMVLSGPKQAR